MLILLLFLSIITTLTPKVFSQSNCPGGILGTRGDIKWWFDDSNIGEIKMQYNYGTPLTNEEKRSAIEAAISNAAYKWANATFGIVQVSEGTQYDFNLRIYFNDDGDPAQNGHGAGTPTWIKINSYPTWTNNVALVDPPYRLTDIYSIILHEMGHTFRLTHNELGYSVMHWQEDLVKRSITDCDRATVENLYNPQYIVTLKNSFNAAGDMLVDNTTVTIPNGGIDSTWDNISFPHTLGAIDQQPAGSTYNQGFYNWSGALLNPNPNTNRTISINAGSGTYTANFSNEYNITFQNSFSDATGGVINVDGQHNAPFQTTALQVNGIDASAVTPQTFNGIRYDFDHWSDASTEGTNHHFTLSDHTTYTAYFTGTPVNVNRNLSFDASDPYEPITVNWNDHPNSNVTYKIWRKSKYQQQPTSSPQLIGSVSHGTTSFVDYDFYGTNLGFTDWKLWYDVKGYFTLDGTSSADDYAQVFSNGMIAKKADDLEDNITVSINENKIDNYPNPFNPSTIISYQIVNAGHVTLKVYDNLGREIKTLVDREQSSGKYSVNFNADNLASGIYYYRITAGGFTATKKMILTK